MASYVIRRKWFGWKNAALSGGGGGAAQTLPVTKVVGGKTYMLDDIEAVAGGDWRVQASPIDPYDAALFVDGVYQTDGTGSGWVAKGTKGVTAGDHVVVIGVKTGSGAGIPGNDLANADIVIDFGKVNFPAYVAPAPPPATGRKRKPAN